MKRASLPHVPRFHPGWVGVATLVVASYAVIGGAISLLGWIIDAPRLTDWDADGISIQPNATIAAWSSGLGLLALVAVKRRIAAALGVWVAAIGGSALFQWLTGIRLGIDDLFMFDHAWGRVGVLEPGRMGPPGATSWTLVGTAMILAARAAPSRLRTAVPVLALVTAAISALSLIGYLYGASLLYMVPTTTVIALQTSSFILAVSLGLMLCTPERDPVRMLSEDSPAGLFVRRIAPASLAVPVALGFIRLRAEGAGYFDRPFGSAVHTLCEIALFLLLLWWTAKALRQQSRQRTRAEDALRAAAQRKDEFLATLAHELRNPLAPIGNAAEIMARKGLTDPEVAWARDVIDRQVRLMARLLDDLLDVARISRDKLHLQVQRVDLESILRSAVEMSTPLIEASQHQVQLDLPPQRIMVEADPVRLGQVFGNLLNNACKYTEPNGQIAIAVAPGAGEAVVTIRDTGIGISRDQLSTIFDMFSQIEGSLHRSRSGLGIGLHLVKRLIEMHGGSIHADSDGAGKGSVFVVRLPLAGTAETAAAITPSSPREAAVSRSRRVLVVDDNTDAAASLAMLLKMSGNEIQISHDGVDCVSVAEEFRPDVIFLDIGLPKLNGYEVCRHIREQPWGKDLMLIAVTGWGQEADRRQSRAAGFDHHLVKPVEHTALMHLLQR